MAEVIIGIPTYRRPIGLKRLLDSIASQTVNKNITIIVADNDPHSGAAESVIQQLILGGYRWPVSRIPVEKKGISEARNALMETAFLKMGANFLVMVDDDQWVDENWLNELLLAQSITQANVVASKVIPDFCGQDATWTTSLPIYWKSQKPSGIVELVDCTAGVLIHKSVVSLAQNAFFDPKFSLIGGGDKEFFVRIKSQGAKFANCNTSIAYEVFDGARLNLDWALKRAYRIGATDMHVILLHQRNFIKLSIEILKIPVSLLCNWILLFNSRSGGRNIKRRLAIQRSLGKISTLFGRKYEEYSVVLGG